MSDISERIDEQLKKNDQDARTAAAVNQLKHLEDIKHLSDQEDSGELEDLKTLGDLEKINFNKQ